MKPKLYPVLEMCIENGLRLGYNRAHKHNDSPAEDVIFEQQYQAIMNEIHDWFEFEPIQNEL